MGTGRTLRGRQEGRASLARPSFQTAAARTGAGAGGRERFMIGFELDDGDWPSSVSPGNPKGRARKKPRGGERRGVAEEAAARPPLKISAAKRPARRARSRSKPS